MKNNFHSLSSLRAREEEFIVTANENIASSWPEQIHTEFECE